MADPRLLDPAETGDRLVASWNVRAAVAETPRARVAAVREQAAEPFRRLATAIAAPSPASAPTPAGFHA